jgi:hypothetical protein
MRVRSGTTMLIVARVVFACRNVTLCLLPNAEKCSVAVSIR